MATQNTQPLTQPSTQQVLDPRRLGRNSSGLSESDIADVICILHPGTPAAWNIAKQTALHRPQHVLNNEDLLSPDNDSPIDEQETVIIQDRKNGGAPLGSQPLALRFSSNTVQPALGFTFGRNPTMCDVVLSVDSTKRISNLHFRLYLKDGGVLMLEDASTNGTLVDDVFLKSKVPGKPSTRMLTSGSVIQILSTKEEEYIKFIVFLPPRQGHHEAFQENYERYMERYNIAQANVAQRPGAARQGGHQGRLAHTAAEAAVGARRPVLSNAYTFGMHWNGGDKYNVIGQLGKGAFATVYKLATALDGQLLAAKELEKKRFMKNGQLDQRLDNEMKIMQTIHHPNVVQYVDYQDSGSHLYIIMEYVPCGDLQNYLSDGRVLPETHARRMARQILHALAYLHQKKITHRDIKPDNILISSEEPFDVKLTDFGLSKVVKSNATFLKTFCGTLLYCAPEVFPHYDGHARAVKRPRASAQAQTFHSYSQSVDIWSFAAVLWYALCGKPPFDGVSDATGRGMFDRIMSTHLDPTPLREKGVSEDAIDLLLQMLNTDPSVRPNEQKCLQHRWLAEDDVPPPVPDSQLNPILEDPEGEDAEEDGDRQSDDAEEEFSQLSLNERRANKNMEGRDSQLFDIDSDDYYLFADVNPSKRIKRDPRFPRDQTRDRDEFELSDMSFEHSQRGDSMTIPPPISGRPRLFGEIGKSALQSSGLLDEETNRALALNASQFGTESQQGLSESSLFKNSQGNVSAASLFGAESMVRQLEMASPLLATTALTAQPPQKERDEPRTPEPEPDPDNTPRLTSESQVNNSQLPNSNPSQETPKAAVQPLDRHIHTKPIALPDTMEMPSPTSVTPNSMSNQSSGTIPTPDPTSSISGDEFVRPRPYLGRLVTTDDSIIREEIKLTKAGTSYGRNPDNTVIYRDIMDSRVPKKAFEIWFHHHNLQEYEKAGKDWTMLDGLFTGITTWSRNGIWINNVQLMPRDSDGKVLYGKVYSGDVITIFRDPKSKQGLSFKLNITKGKGAKRRPPGERFVVDREGEEPKAASFDT